MTPGIGVGFQTNVSFDQPEWMVGDLTPLPRTGPPQLCIGKDRQLEITQRVCRTVKLPEIVFRPIHLRKTISGNLAVRHTRCVISNCRSFPIRSCGGTVRGSDCRSFPTRNCGGSVPPSLSRKLGWVGKPNDPVLTRKQVGFQPGIEAADSCVYAWQ